MAKRNWNSLSAIANTASQTCAGGVESGKHLPSNCFTLGRVGNPVEGIELLLDAGPDALRPWQPFIAVGTRRVHRDRRDGCIYEKRADGKTGHVRHATAFTVQTPNVHTYHVLKKPVRETVGDTSVVKLRFGMRGSKRVIVNGQELRLYTGVDGGTLLERDGMEAIVTVKEGERITIFYEDGAVRSFRREGSSFVEKTLTQAEMLEKRIESAHARLEVLSQDMRPQAEKMAFGLLAGMTELLHLTTVSKEGQELRMKLLKEFFLNLPQQHYNAIYRKLRGTLEAVDRVLVPYLYGNTSSSTVAEISVARQTRDAEIANTTPEERERRRMENKRRDEVARKEKKEKQEAFRSQRRMKAQAAKPGKQKNGDGKKAKRQEDRKAA